MAIDTQYTIGAKDRTGPAAKSAQRNLGGIGSAMTNLGAVGAAAFAGLAVSFGKAAIDLDDVQRDVQKATGATGAALDNQLDQFRQVARDVPQSLDQVGASFGSLRTLVKGSDEAVGALTRRSLDFARVAGGDPATVADALGKSMRAFGLDTDAGSAALDVFTKVGQDFGVEGGKLLTDLNTFGPVLKNLGLDIEDSAVLLGQFNSAGISASRIMPGLNGAMRRLAKEGVTDLRGALNTGIESIRDASSDVEALNTATELFGAEGAQRMTTAIRQGIIGSLDDLGGSLGDTSGLLDQVAEDTLTTGERMSQAWQNVQITASRHLLPVLEAAAEAIDNISAAIDTLDRVLESAGDRTERLSAAAGVAVETYESWGSSEDAQRVNELLAEGASRLHDNDVQLTAVSQSLDENIALQSQHARALEYSKARGIEYSEALDLVIAGDNLAAQANEALGITIGDTTDQLGMATQALKVIEGGSDSYRYAQERLGEKIIETRDAQDAFDASVLRSITNLQNQRQAISGVTAALERQRSAAKQALTQTTLNDFGTTRKLIDRFGSFRQARTAIERQTAELAGLGLGGLPSFATGAFVRRPTVAVVGDAPGGEYVIPARQMRRQPAALPPIDLRLTLELDGETLRQVTLKNVNEGIRSGEVSAIAEPA